MYVLEPVLKDMVFMQPEVHGMHGIVKDCNFCNEPYVNVLYMLIIPYLIM